jgi:hypothetical protein
VSKLQKDNGLMFVLIITTVLIYFISYFFIYISRDSIKIITVDYTTALMSLIPPLVFLASIFIFTRIKSAVRKKNKKIFD